MARGPMSQEQKDKIRATMLARKIQPSDIARESAALARKVKGNTSEHNAAISRACKGVSHSSERVEKNRQAQLKWNEDRRERGEEHYNVEIRRGAVVSQATKDKLSIIMSDNIANGDFKPFDFTGIERSEANKIRVAVAQMGTSNSNWKPADVYDAKTNKVIATGICIAEFCRDMGYGIDVRTLFYMNANDYFTSVKGLIFKYQGDCTWK